MKAEPRLRAERSCLPLWKVGALGLAYMLLGPSTAMSAGALIEFSRQAAWLSNLLSVIVLTLLSLVICAYARRFVVTGSLVSYVHEALGTRARLFVAACLMLGYVALTATMILGVVVFTGSALLDLGLQSAGSPAAECISAVIVSFAAAGFACLGIDVSVRVVLILGFLCVPFVLLAMGAAGIELHPAMANQFHFETVSVHGILQGAVAATGYYVGFDGITALAAETRDPKRNVPRVLIGTVLIVGLAITASCVVQYPLLLEHADALAAGASPVAILAHAVGWNWLAIVVDVLLVPASFAATVTVYNLGARIIATTAADGLLPARLSRISSRFPTPLAAVGALACAATALTVCLQLLLEKPALLTSVYLANLTTYYWLAPYFLVCLGILRILRREDSNDRAARLAAWISMAAIAYVTVEMFRSPVDAGTKYLPYLAVGSIAAVALVFCMTSRAVSAVLPPAKAAA
jgi:amino acid transporter